MHRLLTGLILLLGLTLRPSGAAERFFKAGPHPVGVTTTVFLDHRRTDPATGEPRPLVTEIWYPATEEARHLPRNKYTDFIPGGVTPEIERLIVKNYKKSSAELDRTFPNEAIRDARVLPGRHPVVLFSHGNGGPRHQNTFWCDFLASHGYVLVSADHVGNAPMTIVHGRVIPYHLSVRSISAVDRPRDLSFLLDQMTLWNQGGDSRFAGRLDLKSVCAAGMSFGGMTAVAAADADPRIRSVICMSGPVITHTNLDLPTLWMLGEEDTTLGAVGNSLIRAQHRAHRGPSFLFAMPNGGHMSFTDYFKIDPRFGDGVGSGKRRQGGAPFEYTSMERTYEMINACSLAFLEVYARGRREHLDFLKRNHWVEDLHWEARNLEADQPEAR